MLCSPLPESTGRKAYAHELRKEVVCVNVTYLCPMIIVLLTHTHTHTCVCVGYIQKGEILE